MTVLVAGTDTAAGRAAYRYAIEEARRRGEDLTYFALEGGEHEPSPDLDGVSERVVGPQQRSEDPVGDLLDRSAEQLVHVELDRVSPLAVPVMVMIGREAMPQGSLDDELLLEAETLAGAAMRVESEEPF